MEIICGIYKITSPSGKIYIGQALDIYFRWVCYEKMQCKRQAKLYHSFLKHGVKNHNFEIIYVCEKEKLNELEKYYIDLFKSFNSPHGMNLTIGGGQVMAGRIHSEESKEKMSKAQTGELNSFFGKKHTQETKQKISSRVVSQEAILNMSKAQTGKKKSEETKKTMSQQRQGEKNHFFGKTHSEESIIKMSESKKGEKSYWFGKHHTEETKEKIRQSNRGKKRSIEFRKKMSKLATGRKLSPESIAKREATRKILRQERLTMIF